MVTLVLFGLLGSEILSKQGRSPRVGMALGLALNVLGLALATAIAPPPQDDQRKLTKSGRLWLVFSTLVFVFLVWKGNQLPVDWDLLVAISSWILIIVCFFSSATKKRSIGNLPPAFWLCVALGAALAVYDRGMRDVGIGAYGGAWLWVLGGLLPRRAAALD
jgi:hypothetical protein